MFAVFLFQTFHDALTICWKMRDGLAACPGDSINFVLGFRLNLAFLPCCDELSKFAFVGEALACIHPKRFLECLCQAFNCPVKRNKNCLRVDAVATECCDDVNVGSSCGAAALTSSIKVLMPPAMVSQYQLRTE